MTRVIPLSGNTIARNNSSYVLANLQNHACIAITCASRKTRLSSRFATVYEIVYLGTHANGRILVLNKYTIIRYRRKIILRQFYLTETGADKSTCTQ